jgi:hypothetical protein
VNLKYSILSPQYLSFSFKSSVSNPQIKLQPIEIFSVERIPFQGKIFLLGIVNFSRKRKYKKILSW